MTSDLRFDDVVTLVLAGWPQAEAWPPERWKLYRRYMQRYTHEEAMRGLDDLIAEGNRFAPGLADITRRCEPYRLKRVERVKQERLSRYINELRGEPTGEQQQV